jgi:hypothetical protein
VNVAVGKMSEQQRAGHAAAKERREAPEEELGEKRGVGGFGGRGGQGRSGLDGKTEIRNSKFETLAAREARALIWMFQPHRRQLQYLHPAGGEPTTFGLRGR